MTFFQLLYDRNKYIQLMIVPFGKRSITTLHRVYDEESLLALLRDFKIESLEYFLRTDRFWIKSSIEQVKGMESSMRERAIACVKAVKMPRQI